MTESTPDRATPRNSDTLVARKCVAAAALLGACAILAPTALGIVWGTVVIAFFILGALVFAYAAGIRTERSWR
jgi:hypothetical protein